MSLPDGPRLLLDEHPTWCIECTYDGPPRDPAEGFATLCHESAQLPGEVQLGRMDHILGDRTGITRHVGDAYIYLPPIEELTIDQARQAAAGLHRALQLLEGGQVDA